MSKKKILQESLWVVSVSEKWMCKSGSEYYFGFKPFLTERKKECEVCGSPKIEIHHIVPISNGGAHSEKNVMLLCHKHHQLVTYGRLNIEKEGERRYIDEDIEMASKLFFDYLWEKKKDERLKNWLAYLIFIKDTNIDRIDVMCYSMRIGRRDCINMYGKFGSKDPENSPDIEPNKKQKIEKYLESVRKMFQKFI